MTKPEYQLKISEIIAWAVAAQGLLLSALMMRVPFVLDRFENACRDLHVKLSEVTVIFLGIPSWAWVVVPLLINAVSILMLMKCRNTPMKFILVIGGQVVICAMTFLVVWGMIFPSFLNMHGPLS